jgi:non-ribosomal peptide synthetase component F
VSVASLCHLAWAMVLGRVSAPVSKRDDVVFGTVLFGRMQGGEGADRTLGLFINTLPVSIHVGEEEVESSARRVHRLLAELIRHEHASLALAQKCSGVEAPAPLFSALFNYRHNLRKTNVTESEAASAWTGIDLLSSEERTNYPLLLSIDDLGEGMALTTQTVAAVDPCRVNELMRAALERLVEALENNPERAVREIDILPEAERRQVVEEWNATEADYPKEKLIHKLFEERAEIGPHAIALVCEEQSLTYIELNKRANRLAHHLRRLGVGPESLVGICMERSMEMVVALLATLKAGAAYLPLDPAYPPERLAYMLEDGSPSVTLTQERFLGVLPNFSGEIVCLDRDDSLMLEQSEENPPSQVTGEDPAYVIYTSGSTGRPKGVMGLHRGAINRFSWMWRTYPFTAGEVACQKTSLNFLDSLWEIFGPVLQGVRTVIIRDDAVKDVYKMARILQSEQVSRLVLVPSLLRPLLESIDDLPGAYAI